MVPTGNCSICRQSFESIKRYHSETSYGSSKMRLTMCVF